MNKEQSLRTKDRLPLASSQAEAFIVGGHFTDFDDIITVDDLYQDKQFDDEQAQEKEKKVKISSLRNLIEDKLGYKLEKHVYTTKDGYINTVFRINVKNSDSVDEK